MLNSKLAILGSIAVKTVSAAAGVISVDPNVASNAQPQAATFTPSLNPTLVTVCKISITFVSLII